MRRHLCMTLCMVASAQLFVGCDRPSSPSPEPTRASAAPALQAPEVPTPEVPTPEVPTPAKVAAPVLDAVADAPNTPAQVSSPARSNITPTLARPSEGDCQAFEDVWLCTQVEKGELFMIAHYLADDKKPTDKWLFSEMSEGAAFCVISGTYGVELGAAGWRPGEEGKTLLIPVTRTLASFEESARAQIEDSPCDAAEKGLLKFTTHEELLAFTLR